jgi:hypothetical protein
MVIKYTNIFHYKIVKFIQIGIFGLKRNHLATLFQWASENRKRETVFQKKPSGNRLNPRISTESMLWKVG